MTLSLVRIDDRLIHGQVIAVWYRALGADVIVVADDETAADEFLSDVLVLAAPPGVNVEVYTVDDSIARIKELAESTDRAFILMRSPLAALRMVELGVPIPVLNIGGMGAATGRSSLYRNISASPAEIETMRELERKGTKVEIRIVADDPVVTFSSVAP
ncbi:MAG: PTS sugar transporter subunit IIB [Microbacteriaceae bacterium]|nr:PTS sugar transporter subunit IIB [Cryobacterium sp.]MBX3104689.1 PTS sugar transporter subunit IIB [Cryobacterium sp.]MCC6376595.1 PTS sugar transporter subunit IIB [Microbacteriaceae bacterium]